MRSAFLPRLRVHTQIDTWNYELSSGKSSRRNSTIWCSCLILCFQSILVLQSLKALNLQIPRPSAQANTEQHCQPVYCLSLALASITRQIKQEGYLSCDAVNLRWSIPFGSKVSIGSSCGAEMLLDASFASLSLMSADLLPEIILSNLVPVVPGPATLLIKLELEGLASCLMCSARLARRPRRKADAPRRNLRERPPSKRIDQADSGLLIRQEGWALQPNQLPPQCTQAEYC